MKKYIVIFFMLSSFLFSSSNFEVNFHASYWSANLFAPIIEENFTPDFEDYDAEKGNFNLDFYGSNFGIEFRYYPGGKNGSFSIGISYERNSFKSDLKGTYEDYDDNGYRYVTEASGYLEAFPHSFNFSIRWDIFPKSKFHPYFNIGFGFGKIDGLIKVDTTTTHYTESGTIVEHDSEEMTFQEALDDIEEEGESFPISFFPILNISFGIKGEIFDNFYLLGEIALYDGLIFRGGVAYRF